MATLYYRPYTTDLQNDDESNISERTGLLPEYQYIFDPEKDSVVSEPDIKQNLNDENTPDVDRYKLAMRQMSSEILYLREQMKELLQKNSKLRCNSCGHHKETTILLGDMIDMNSISKEELIKRYMILYSNYEESCTDLKTYQDKVHKLQIELIKKNDQEAEFLKMNKAHSSQNVLIQNLQKRISKIKLLEGTIKDQEIIIAKMEKQFEKNNKNKTGNLSPIIEILSAREKDTNNSLQEENNRLRNEIDIVKNSQTKVNNVNNMSDSERLELYQLLDKAEQRIMALERQISNNQRDWQRESKKKKELDEFGLSKIKF